MQSIFLIVLIASHAVCAMTPENKQKLECRCLQRFTNFDQARNVQMKVGVELVKAAALEDAFAQTTIAREKKFYLKEFYRNFAEPADPNTQSLYFETPVINHEGTHLAIPLQNRIHIVDLHNKNPDETIIASDYQRRWDASKIAWSFDDRYIALFTFGRWHIYNTHSGKSIDLLENILESSIFCWHPKNFSHFIIINRDSGSINIIDVLTGLLIRCVQIPWKEKSLGVYAAECSPDGRYLALNNEAKITIIDLTGQSFFYLDQKKGQVCMPTWSLNGKYLAHTFYNGPRNNDIFVWDIQTRACVAKISKPMSKLKAIAWTAWSDKLICIGAQYIADTKPHYHYVRMCIDPWDKQNNSMTDSPIMTPEWASNHEHYPPVNPLCPDNEHNKRLNQLLKNKRIHMSHHGNFLIGTNNDTIVVLDYGTEQQTHEYLQSEIPLKQAMILLAIFKSALKKEKLLLDSPNIQRTFKQLPTYLQEGLSTWVKKPQSTLEDWVLFLFTRLFLRSSCET